MRLHGFNPRETTHRVFQPVLGQLPKKNTKAPLGPPSSPPKCCFLSAPRRPVVACPNVGAGPRAPNRRHQGLALSSCGGVHLNGEGTIRSKDSNRPRNGPQSLRLEVPRQFAPCRSPSFLGCAKRNQLESTQTAAGVALSTNACGISLRLT